MKHLGKVIIFLILLALFPYAAMIWLVLAIIFFFIGGGSEK